MLNQLSRKSLVKGLALGLSSAGAMLMFSAPILAEKVETSEMPAEVTETVETPESVTEEVTETVTDGVTESMEGVTETVTDGVTETTEGVTETVDSESEKLEPAAESDYQPVVDPSTPKATEEEKPETPTIH